MVASSHSLDQAASARQLTGQRAAQTRQSRQLRTQLASVVLRPTNQMDGKCSYGPLYCAAVSCIALEPRNRIKGIPFQGRVSAARRRTGIKDGAQQIQMESRYTLPQSAHSSPLVSVLQSGLA